ncbi:MAG TPA: hypothetical protein VER03_23175 [Bryobacteraceae bacterium]|nr:hypothetical protein [Bryobacteraceae bacterium]
MRAVAALSLAVFAAAGLGAVSRTDYLNAKKKFQAIDKHAVKPGSRVAITASELNAYVQAELPTVAPKGVRSPQVELEGDNTATGRAMIDFVKLRSAGGKQPGWLFRKLFSGEKEVAVTTRITSGGGRATVDLKKVEVAGIPIEGAALDFLVKNYLLPNYPNAKIGRPFALHKRVDRIEVTPAAAYVVTR